MNSVQGVLWGPVLQSKHAPPYPAPLPSHLRHSHVITAPPAKRITFYKSGDSQFGGVRMAIHKRSFKCFDALLDDLSQKVPLPFGVRTVTTPRGTHTIKHLEQLQDGGCYLCSDRRHVKPINMELAGKRQGVWHHHHGRRPHRPEAAPATPPGHGRLPHRPRRILLVKNSEPGIRRTIVLNRMSTRSLRAFMDEVSEIMEFHVRKLYTAEGRRIDSIQSLVTCPGVLVCVGREAFSPMLINYIRKTSDEKLPGLSSKSPGLGPRTPGNGARSPANQGIRSPPHGAQSRASEYDESYESKKNVNFGLETRKSIIHPRSDSSNRSTRFSVSSEKSYGVYPQKPSIMNDDIEKRVLVNKDGSLSLEMRVRFHLQNDETIQWSTQIKKSPSLTNESCPLDQASPHYLQQGQSESCSDPDSTTFETMDFPTQALHCPAGTHCPCCYHKEERPFDLWENPAHSIKHVPVPPSHASSHPAVRHTQSSSSSSSCSSRRMVRCRAHLSRSRGGSGAEQNQVVQQEMRVTEEVEHRVEMAADGDTQVEVCKVSRCCSRTEVVAVDTGPGPLYEKSVEGDLVVGDDDNRPLSAVSSSSRILQSLREDQDDDEDDLPPSVSQCCHRDDPTPLPTPNRNENGASVLSASTAHSAECKNCGKFGDAKSRSASAASSHRSKSGAPLCEASTDEIVTSSISNEIPSEIPIPEEVPAGAEEGSKRTGSALSGTTGCSANSQKSTGSGVCLNCGGCKRGVGSTASSRASNTSKKSQRTSSPHASVNGDCNQGSEVSAHSNEVSLTNADCAHDTGVTEDDETSVAALKRTTPEVAKEEAERSPSTSSVKSNNCENLTGDATGKAEDRSCSVSSNLSKHSAKSQKSNTSASAIPSREEADGENSAERPVSAISNKSAASVKSRQSNCLPIVKNEEVESDERVSSRLSVKSNGSAKSEKAGSVLSEKSSKSHTSTKSARSHKTMCSHCAKATSPSDQKEEELATDVAKDTGPNEDEKRAESVMSQKSNLSATSNKSLKSNIHATADTDGGGEERASSQVSGRLSVKSTKSSKCTRCEKPSSPNLEETEETENRPSTAKSSSSVSEKQEVSSQSGKSVCSAKTHHTQDDTAEVDRSPSVASKSSHNSAKSNRSNHNVADLDNDMNANQGPIPSAENTNIVTIKTPEDIDDNENITQEGRSSVASGMSHKSNHERPAQISVVEPAELGEDVVVDEPKGQFPCGQTLSPRRRTSSRSRSPKVSSPIQKLLPSPDVGELRGNSALSVHSVTSTKSGRSRCCCSAASGSVKPKTENEVKDTEDGKSEVFSEKAVSTLSTSSKRQRMESEGTEKPLSRNSSGSVSLGLPEDQDVADSDSGKSTASFHDNSDGKVEDVEKSLSPNPFRDPEEQSQEENAEPPVTKVDVPAVEIRKGHEEGEGEDTERASSELRAKSRNSQKSCCSCGKAPTVQSDDGKSEKRSVASRSTKSKNKIESDGGNSTSPVNIPDTNSRSSTAMSRGSRVRNKSPASAVDEQNQDNRLASQATSQGSCRHRSETKTPTPSQSKNASESCEQEVVHTVDDVISNNEGGSAKMSHKKANPEKLSSHCPVHNPRPGSKVGACSESTLSNSLSAADLLKECVAATHQNRQPSEPSRTKPESEKGERCPSGQDLKAEEGELQLSPACLPNASPNEVVSDWLRSIPADGNLAPLNSEFTDDEQTPKEMDETLENGPVKEEEGLEDKQVEKDTINDAQEGEERDLKVKCEVLEGEKTLAAAPGDSVGTSASKKWHSSAAVMKVLLGSTTGRCRSLPEVSPVYGRRLSTSAKGLLDCLAQLQLIEPATNCSSEKDRKQRYDEIMTILQSLWLTEPRDTVGKEVQDTRTDQVTPPRSSSGVGMSSGSGGSGKDNGNHVADDAAANLNEAQPKVEEEEKAEPQNRESEHEETPKEVDETAKKEDLSPDLDSLDSPKTNENPSSSDKSYTNDGSKSATDNERDTLEDSPTAQRPMLAKRQSQDPDPVWVLNLLKKLEKQFINHYSDAMAEFKVRWELDDSLILDTMISELRDEVSRRIQSSIKREIKKIQSRAGRSPRPPPLANLSRESTMTEKRRRMLKVMKNQSVKTGECASDEETAAEFSDQRSEDEYCPCDACVRKKMAARPFRRDPLAAEAPVMMEFDLLKILQLKKSPMPAPVKAPQPADSEDSLAADQEGRNLEVVDEEDEEDETKEDIKADIVLEETIPEEDEDVVEDENEGKQEPEEAEASECTCHLEEEADKTSDCTDSADKGGLDTEENEGDTGEDDEEESDKDTVKKVASCEVEPEDDPEADECAKEGSTSVEDGKAGGISTSAEAEGEEEGGEEMGPEESPEGEDGEESGDQEVEASEEEGTSSQSPCAIHACATEGEDADVEDSDDNKNADEACAEESGRDEKHKESGKEEEGGWKKEEGCLLHQFTKTSVESQPGSMEDVDSPPNQDDSGGVSKLAGD